MTPPIIPSHLPPQRLLLVDDDPLLLETLQEVLTAEGFKVVTAANGEAAEQLLQAAKTPFDLVLTDLVMPGRSGMDVLRSALKLNPSCTVLVLSGFGTVREATEAMDLGAYGLVNKPLQMDPFRQTLRRILERTQLMAERNALKAQVLELRARVESLETMTGRMEMMAQQMTPPAQDPQTHLSSLQELVSLHTRGLLSLEEFEAAKKALLSKWLA